MRDYNAWNVVVRRTSIIPGFIHPDPVRMGARQAATGWRPPLARHDREGTTAPSLPAPEQVETVNAEMEVEERKAGENG